MKWEYESDRFHFELIVPGWMILMCGIIYLIVHFCQRVIDQIMMIMLFVMAVSIGVLVLMGYDLFWGDTSEQRLGDTDTYSINDNHDNYTNDQYGWLYGMAGISGSKWQPLTIVF